MESMQHKIRAFMARHDIKTDPETRFIDLVSEVGELGKELLTATDYGRRPGQLSPAAADEMGDCLFSLLCLCEELCIDPSAVLDSALDKYEARLAGKGSMGSR